MSTFSTPEPIMTALTTAGARVRIVASERPDTVVRVEPVDSANPTDLEVAEKTKVDFSGGVLAVKTTKSGAKNGSVAITIELPIGSRLVLNTAWTEVHADGLLGDCELNLASGHVRLDRIGGLRGNLGSSEVEIGHVAGAADVEGSAAGLRIGEVEGVVRYQGATGRVWIGHARTDVDLGSSSGSFDIDRAEGNVIAKAAHCPIRIGRLTRGRVELMNASGGIEVGITAGTAALVDAKSTKGLVRSTVFTQDDPKIEVYARARLDDIVIRRVAA